MKRTSLHARTRGAPHGPEATGRCLRLKLLRLNAERHLLLVTMHHIICDGISLGILMRDMVGVLRGIVTGTDRDAARAAHPVRATTPSGRRSGCTSEEPAARSSSGAERWATTFRRLSLPRDRRCAGRARGRPRLTGPATSRRCSFPRDLRLAHTPSASARTSRFNILLFSVFAALLQRLTGQLDLVIGSPCANRNEDTEELIGLFMNIQVMRLRLQQSGTLPRAAAAGAGLDAWRLREPEPSV